MDYQEIIDKVEEAETFSEIQNILSEDSELEAECLHRNYDEYLSSFEMSECISNALREANDITPLSDFKNLDPDGEVFYFDGGFSNCTLEEVKENVIDHIQDVFIDQAQQL